MEVRCQTCGEEFLHTQLETSETGYDCCPYCGSQAFTKS
jgi:DNA-directed RNA polymerase subunit RPC12/RpoP